MFDARLITSKEQQEVLNDCQKFYGRSFVESLLWMRAKTRCSLQKGRKKGTRLLSCYRSLNCKCAEIDSQTTQIPKENSQNFLSYNSWHIVNFYIHLRGLFLRHWMKLTQFSYEPRFTYLGN